jgi:hypothetical protein
MAAATAVSPTRRRANPCLTASGDARGRLGGWPALLFEGKLSVLPYFLLAAFVVAALGTLSVELLSQLAGDATGILVVIWLVVGVAALALLGGALSFARFGWMVLAAAGLSVIAQLADGAGSTVELFAAVAGRAMLAGVVALVALNLARAWENRATGRSRKAAWALELAALLIAGAAFALLLPFAWPVQAGAFALVMLLVAPQAVAFAQGEERAGRLEAAVSAVSQRSRSTASGASVDAEPRAVASDGASPAKPAARHPAPKPEKLKDLLEELDSYPGLVAVKKQVHDLVDFLQVQRDREKHGMKAASATAHMRFEGPAGTGKTEMARLVARILAALGVVERGHLVEVSRSKLVGRFQGHTADAVQEMCDQAQGGVLFIDEAYALFTGDGDSFGAEAVTELIARMENDRDSFVVILAGYSREMARLMNSNAGLRSRIERVITFPAYAPDELLAIAQRFAEHSDYDWDAEAAGELHRVLSAMHGEQASDWGNARDVRKLFKAATAAQATRISGRDASKTELRTLTDADVRAAVQQYRAERDADRAGQRQAQPALGAF